MDYLNLQERVRRVKEQQQRLAAVESQYGWRDPANPLFAEWVSARADLDVNLSYLLHGLEGLALA